jgi:hypothetical protein
MWTPVVSPSRLFPQSPARPRAHRRRDSSRAPRRQPPAKRVQLPFLITLPNAPIGARCRAASACHLRALPLLPLCHRCVMMLGLSSVPTSPSGEPRAARCCHVCKCAGAVRRCARCHVQLPPSHASFTLGLAPLLHRAAAAWSPRPGNPVQLHSDTNIWTMRTRMRSPHARESSWLFPQSAAVWPPPLGISPPRPPGHTQETSRVAPHLLHASATRCQPRPPLLHRSAHMRAPGAKHAARPRASTHCHPFCPRASSYKNPLKVYLGPLVGFGV